MAGNLKRSFNFLALFSFLSVACFALVLFYSRRSFMVIVPETHILTLGNKTFSGIVKERVAKLLAKRIKASNKSSEMARIPSAVNITLGTCPDNPPDLVGPLLIEFDFRRTWEYVRKEVSPSLQKGGRFKPKDCVAKQKVAIIIPFRNRHEHLKHWLYYLHPILKRQFVDYGVYVINQDGEGVFNRAKLMNVGYVEALKDYDYDCFLFSDVDLVPLDDRNLYRCFDNPRHLAIGMDKFKFNLPYKTFFGGVASFSKHQYLKINGFPNTYWGWGGEDDDIYKRIIFRGMQVSRPDLRTGRYRMIRHQRDEHNDPNPKNPDKLFRTRWTMNADGINSLRYTVKNVERDILYTFITVDIGSPE